MTSNPSVLHTDTPRMFQDEDIYRPVKYKGKTVPFALAKMDMWANDIELWAREQVFTKDESDGLVKAFPAHLDYFWYIDELIEKFGIVVIPKTRRMMMTHYGLSVRMAHNLIFQKNSYNCIVTLREDTAQQHLRDRTLNTLQHLDYRFPYPRLNEKKESGIVSTASQIYNYENKAGVYAYPSGSGKVRGMTVTYAFFDEYAHQVNQFENWEAVSPALEGKNCRGLFVSSVEPGTYMEEMCNDISEESPYITVKKGLNYTINSKGACIVGLNYRANPDKDPDTPKGLAWYRKERKKYDKYAWLKEYEGRWRFPIQGRVFYEYKKDKHSTNFEEQADCSDTSNINIGFDPGYRYPCAVITWVNSVGNICVEHAIMQQNINIDAFIENTMIPWLNRKFGNKWKGRDRWFLDPAGKSNSNQGGSSAKKMLRKLLNHNRVFEAKKTSPIDRVNFINILFSRGKILVNPNAGTFYPESGKAHHGTFVDMLEWGYQFKDPKEKGQHQDREPDKDGFWDHMADALGYLIAAMFKEDLRKIRYTRLGKPSKAEKENKWYAQKYQRPKTSNTNKTNRFSVKAKPRI